MTTTYIVIILARLQDDEKFGQGAEEDLKKGSEYHEPPREQQELAEIAKGIGQRR